MEYDKGDDMLRPESPKRSSLQSCSPQRVGRTVYRRTAILSMAVSLLVLGGCSSEGAGEAADIDVEPMAAEDGPPLSGPIADSLPQSLTIDPTGGIFPPDDSDIRDVESVYQVDGYDQTDVVRLDVRTVTGSGPCIVGNYTGCTLADLELDINRRDDWKPRIDVHFQADDYPDDGSVSNAELRLRGGSTRRAEQKSYRIRFHERDNLWRGERSLLLNKHPFEATRIRNKIAFDLMAQIPNLLSFRSQFTNLWLDDGQGAVDYGLFTHIEAPGGNYLERRGLSRDDRLYKVNFFRFEDDDLRNVQVDSEGQPLDKDLFETSLDIESGDDHRPLVKMLRDFHDPSRSFEDILDQYFNHNNVLTWIAVNFLLNQSDAITHNFLLYNPTGTERFYFLPWDYDGALSPDVEPPAVINSNSDLQRRLFAGYARGSKSDFHSRYYRLPGIHEKIVAAATYLRENYLTDDIISEHVQLTEQAVESFVTRSPDIDFNTSYSPNAAAQFPLHVANNLDALSTRYSYPMPPEMLTPVLVQESWEFEWRTGYDPTGHSVTYELQISNGLEFDDEQIVLRIVGIDESEAESIPPDRIDDINDLFGRIKQRVGVTALRPGEHFARVIARSSRDPERFWQVSDNIVQRDGESWYGPVAFDNP